MTYLQSLQEAVQKLHHCTATHQSTFYVKHLFNDKIVWEGDVEAFQIKENPQSEKCYAWGWEESGKLEIATVLGVDPVVGPEEAVIAWCRQKVAATQKD